MYWTVYLEGGPRRVNHAAVNVGQKIYSFGGFCNGENYQIPRPIDVHVLDTISLRWSLIIPTNPYEEVPFQRYGHVVVAYAENIYLWGGRNDERACNILYCFNTLTRSWHCPKVSGQIPGARDGHSCCIVEDKMYIFGGYEESVDRFSQDVVSLDLKTMTWNFTYTRGIPPWWRDFHSSTPVGHRMYIFGGRGDRQGPIHSQDEIYCNQIIYLDTQTMRWVHPETKGSPPIGRRSHSAFVYKGQLYVIGGYNGLINKHFGDLHRFDPETNTWSLVQVKGRGPCSRRRQCCCLLGDKLYLFGGTSPSQGHTTLPVMPDILDGMGPSSSLMDHADLHVLDFFPSLKTLCILLVIEKKLDLGSLPKDIRWEIATMTTNNSISRPLQNTG